MIMINFSGGKDSVAMLLLAQEMKLDFVAVYQDTGFEHPTHYEYIDYVRDKTGADIRTVKNPKYDGLIDLCQKKEMLPNRLARFCTTNLKVNAAKEFILAHKEITESWIGVRTGESTARANRYEGINYDDTFPLSDFPDYSKRDYGHIKCRLPIVEWTLQMVWDIHKKHGRTQLEFVDIQDQLIDVMEQIS